MTTPRRLLAVACLLVLGVSACSDDDDSSATTSFAIDTPATVAATAPATDFPTVPTIGPVTAETTDIPITPTGTGDIPVVPFDTTDTPVLVSAVVGEDTGPERIGFIPLGATVTLTVVDNDSTDEFHLHGYDLGDGQEFAAGDTASFTFTADMAGDFELESHESGDVLLILQRAVTSLAVLAHQGGWDEILLVAGPIAIIGWLLWLAKRRLDRHPPP